MMSTSISSPLYVGESHALSLPAYKSVGTYHTFAYVYSWWWVVFNFVMHKTKWYIWEIHLLQAANALLEKVS
jgi:hypothetical protein